MSTDQNFVDRSGWTIHDWCLATSISRATFNKLPDNIRPDSVSLGRRRIITEQPADWLRRLGERGRAQVLA